MNPAASGAGLAAATGIAQAALAAACLLAALAVLTVMRRRRDIGGSARLVAWLFVAFLVATAGLHVADLLLPRLQAGGYIALFEVAAAATALAAAVLIWPLVPRLLTLPSPGDLSRANHALTQANASLETTIAWRTHELEQTKARFEQALSRSNASVFTQDRAFRYTWVFNPGLGLSEAELLGRTTAELLPEEAEDESLPLKLRALETGQTVNAVVAMPRGGEGRAFLDMTVSPTVDAEGRADGVLCTSIDVTEKRLFEVRLASMATQLGTAYQRFELALENSPITVFEQGPDLRYTYVYNPPPGTRTEDYIGRSDVDLFPEAEQRKLVPLKERVLAGSREAVELEIEVGGTQRFYDLRLEPKTDATGEVLGVVGTALDLTDRRRDEQRMRLMMRELTHRSKNLLAVIQAMARKTASLSGDIDSFIADFSARLRAMAAAHDLLVSQSWHGADLGELIRASVAQTIAPTAEQVHMSGPALMLAPDVAQSLSLAFHELATNASKYGALAADAGELEISWSREADGAVRIRWQEQGGPPVKAPERHGFGRVLLERLVGATLNGRVTLDFRPDGLVCDIVFPQEGLTGLSGAPKAPAHG